MKEGSRAASNAAGFPWGDNSPTRRQRIIVALSIAGISAILHWFRAAEHGGRSDFTPLWHAGRLLLEGRNPYDLIGPGNVFESNWPIFYPATAFVAAIPFGAIPFHSASALFVFLSVLLLAYGATADGWQRLPMFPSIAFLTSAQLAQWSLPMTAAMYIPVLGFLAAAKPQSALPVVGSSTDPRMYRAAIAGAVVLLVASFVLLPSWLTDWWGLLKTTGNFVPPVMRFGGFLILAVMLRWRRPEAWLVFLAACVPQTWLPYNGLILLTVAITYREACVLSLVSSAGWIFFSLWFEGQSEMEKRSTMAAVLNVTGYLAATSMILLRPNEGNGPLWLQRLMKRRSGPETPARFI